MSQRPSTIPPQQTFTPAARVRGFGTTVFAEFTALAIEHNAVNLGQGFPNFPAPDFIKEAAQRAIAADLNQYARSAGHPRLVNALSAVYSPLFGRELDPLHEIVVTVGATEGIFATIQALVEPGDEVILIEPFYDSYPAAVTMAGGTPVYVPLRPTANRERAAGWALDMDELRAAFSPRTRLLILNTPQNPIGKVFSREELAQIAALVQEFDAYVLSDEVYEWMVYGDGQEPVEHVRIATLPGMWERTITLGSAGKTFSVTGWKIGWAIAPAPIAHAIFMAHQWIPFAVATPLQEAVACAFEEAEARGYFNWLRTTYRQKRDRLLQVLQEVGLQPVSPDGSYFIIFETGHLDVPVPPNTRRDYAVCRWFTQEVGVAAIPPSPFYSPPHKHLTDNLARFTFCKTDDLLEEAAERLRAALG
ncbi:aminotransferase class I/II-fold pyridoxal phosphate-dependent enzyme [Litorilinea aerophila]|uniref:Aminotransferase class I/II-fold pyridoxal phosphate-dependent enzyme n=1 Tax=Litorilinea aerophila TaxID=1204385 RepID=A0A540VC79_9CHLR|nr:aminotransferase class I/II-fold pyridoxal phosphate-dependent enzyme [Litorilinea aerophila]MCC9077757.1 aminotransferase class I/II-fold pyridoxal phosphate-dependent enzyme [Litorilinea aerophila]